MTEQATASWPEVLSSLIAREDLSSDQTAWAMGEVLAGEATPAQIAGFAVALRAKGETVAEMEGLVEAMYAAATPLEVPGRTLDVVGTGGDRSFSVNMTVRSGVSNRESNTAQISRSWCQSRHDRARRDISTPSTRPTRPSPTTGPSARSPRR